MPPASEYKRTAIGHLLIGVIVIGLTWWCIKKPALLVFLVLIAFGAYIEILFSRRRLRTIATSRTGESICSFANSFDCRKTDTWIIRAVYDALQEQLLQGKRARFPIRATDRFREDLRLDYDDLNETAQKIARRTGYELVDTKKNPLYDKVNTVYDLVMFFTYQPKGKNEKHALPARRNDAPRP